MSASFPGENATLEASSHQSITSDDIWPSIVPTNDKNSTQPYKPLAEIRSWHNSLHATAVTSLAVSILVSAANLGYLVRNGRSTTFWKWRPSERLVMYLSVCDLLYSINHMGDHSIALITGQLPQGTLCDMFGFFLSTLGSVQAVIILLTAISAFCLMVRERGISYGRYDWRLLAAAVLVPSTCGIVIAGLGLYGPSEVWCMADLKSMYHDVINMFYSILLTITFVCCAVCYGAVYWKIRATAALMKVMTKGNDAFSHKQRSYSRAARIMCCFVLAFLSQWFAYIVYSIWSFLQEPPVWLLGVNVCLCNMGGLFNFLAYTFVRRQHRTPRWTGQHSADTSVNDRKGSCTQSHIETSGASFSGNLVSTNSQAKQVQIANTGVQTCKRINKNLHIEKKHHGCQKIEL